MGALNVNAFKDGDGTTVTGGLRMWDESGAGTGPWSQAPLSLGLVSGSVPDYSANDGATRPWSIDFAGKLRTLDLSALTQLTALAEVMGTTAAPKNLDPDDDDTALAFFKGIVHFLAAIDARDAAAAAATNPFLTQDAGPGWVSVCGVAGAAFTSADAQTAVAVTAAPTTGEKLCIDDVIVSVGATAMAVSLVEETSLALMFPILYMPANSTVQITPRGKRQLLVANKKLLVDASAAGNISVLVTYHSEA